MCTRKGCRAQLELGKVDTLFCHAERSHLLLRWAEFTQRGGGKPDGKAKHALRGAQKNRESICRGAETTRETGP